MVTDFSIKREINIFYYFPIVIFIGSVHTHFGLDWSAASGLSALMASTPYELIRCLWCLRTVGQRPLWTGPLPLVSPHGWPALLMDWSAASGLSAQMASAPYGVILCLGSLRTDGQCPLKSSTNEIFTPSSTRNDTNIASDSARHN